MNKVLTLLFLSAITTGCYEDGYPDSCDCEIGDSGDIGTETETDDCENEEWIFLDNRSEILDSHRNLKCAGQSVILIGLAAGTWEIERVDEDLIIGATSIDLPKLKSIGGDLQFFGDFEIGANNLESVGGRILFDPRIRREKFENDFPLLDWEDLPDSEKFE